MFLGEKKLKCLHIFLASRAVGIHKSIDILPSVAIFKNKIKNK